MPAARVRRIQRPDPLLNGVLIGAGVGAALTCTAHPGCGSAPVAVTAHVIADHGIVHLLLLGAGIGALVDARWHRTLYEASETARLSVTPLASTRRAGAGLTVRWCASRPGVVELVNAVGRYRGVRGREAAHRAANGRRIAGMPTFPGAMTPPMSAVPRWSHRDPVEGGNPFLPADPRHQRWAKATAAARGALAQYDDGLVTSARVTSDPRIYGRQLIELALTRFDTWARRGLASVDSDARQRDYEAWLRDYVANWQVYVAETCPHASASARDEIRARLAARATHWTSEAQRAADGASDRRAGPVAGDA